MEDLLTYPEVQSAALPFLVALIVVGVLKSVNTRLVYISVMSGFMATALLLNGLDFVPLNGTRKIILAGIVALVVALFFQMKFPSWRYRPVFLAVLGVLALLWVTGPVMMRIEGASKWVVAVASCAYVIWQIVMLDRLYEKPVQASSCVLALGLGTGFSAILGASALYGQLSMSIGAAAGALLCWFFILQFSTDKNQKNASEFKHEFGTGLLLTYPVAVLLSLFGIATILFADLSWIALVFLALIPLAAHISLPHFLQERFSNWQRMIFLNIIVMAPAALAVFSVWYMTEDSLY